MAGEPYGARIGSHGGARTVRLAETALVALDEARIEYRLRKPPGLDAMRADEPELDIWLSRSSEAAADIALGRAGFHRVVAPGHAGHRFYLGFDGEFWLKVDAKLEPEGGSRGAGRASGPWGALWRARPASLRRLGPVVAILGPDGVGKGSVITVLQHRLPIGATVVYFGRLGSRRAHTASEHDRRAGTVRECAFVFRKYLLSWRRLLVAYAAAWRGHVVLCDRHPLEVLAIQPTRAPLAARLEQVLARRLTPRPDAIVVLDAPAETIWERKAEHSVEVLNRWRSAYRSAFVRARVVSTDAPLYDTAAGVSAVVWDALSARRRWTGTH